MTFKKTLHKTRATKGPRRATSDQLRVLVVGPLPEPYNGMTVITDTILASSLREQFIVRHVDTSDHRPIDNVGRLDVPNVALGLQAALSAAWAVGRVGVDLVYLPVAKQRLPFLRDALFLIAAHAGRKTILVHLHAEGFAAFASSQPRWMQVLIRGCLRNRRVHSIVVGECLRNEFTGLVPASRVHVLPNGTPDFRTEGSRVETPDMAPTVLYLATLWSAKGLFDLLEAAAQLRRRIPTLRVVMAGGWYSPAEAEAARRFIAENELEECVDMVGPVGPDAKRRLLSSASVLALPSHTEGHPLVVLEALSAAVPVVATEVGAVPEMIDDGVEGFLVPVGDVDSLSERLARVLESPARRAEMSRWARERYEREFSAERFTDRLGAVWVGATGAAPKRESRTPGTLGATAP